MKLLKLTLDNFRAAKHLDFVPDGKNAAIYGKNSTGKTTVYNAYTWLLFGKSATGEKNFSPKTLDGAGQEKHHLDHGVEGVFLLDDGSRLTLARILSEKHTKKQGTGDVVFEGNTTEYYINGVPAKAKEYDATVKSICDEEKMKILTMPDYFAAALPWQKRREIMLDVVGDVLFDDDIISSRQELAPLRDYLMQYGTRYTIEQLLKVAKEERRKLLKDLEDIPVRIDETTKRLRPMEYTREDLEQQIEMIQQMIDGLEEEKQQISVPDAVAEGKTRLAELQAKLVEEQLKFITDNPDNYTEQLSKLRSSISAQKIDLERLQREYRSLTLEEKRLNEDRERTAREYNIVQQEQWTGSTICPTCGRELPAEKVEAAKRKFHLEKSQKQERLNQYGKEHCNKDMIVAVQQKIIVKQAEIDEIEKTILDSKSHMEQLQEQQKFAPKFENSEVYQSIQNQIRETEEQKCSGNQMVATRLDGLMREITEKRQQLTNLQQQLFVLDANEQCRRRIGELEEDEQRISANLEQAEYKISLCDKFMTAKIEMLTKQFNSHFQHVRFKLFEQQINGGYTECCEVMIPCEQDGEQMLVPYNQANTGSRMYAGLEIINTLGRYWNMSLPVFIDNAESYTSLPQIESQVIQLIVNAADAVLRIEVEEEQVAMNITEPVQMAGDCIGIEF